MDNKIVHKFRHPGSGRRQASPKMKGRQVDDKALAEIQALLGEQIIRRDHLIEYLHLIQDKYGYLGAAHLAALAHMMKLPMAEIYEVASFYAHFDIVLENETPPPPLTIRVCDSLSCMMAGAEQLKTQLEAGTDKDSIRILRAPCMGRCDIAPVLEIGHAHLGNASVEKALKMVENQDTHAKIPADARGFATYRADGGYDLLQTCRADKYSRDDFIAMIAQSGLRGLGGAGFPAAKKWQFVRAEAKPRLFAINGDEGEPGTIKDYYYLARDPHRFLEGMLIAAWVVEAEHIFIYLRDEYPDIRLLLQRELALLQQSGLTNGITIELRRGAGAYICGEESAMIESIEGKRGLPRHRPPFVAQKGIFNRPTLVHNVETVYAIRDIIEQGAENFSARGINGRQGMRSFSVSGRVKDKGVKYAPAGITIKQLIEDYCGGMEDGHHFKAYLPGGASGGILPANMDDIPLDFDTLQEYGCFIGSAAVVVLSDKDHLPDMVRNLMLFFEDESCGQCTPCRNGTEKMVNLLKAEQWNIALMKELSDVMIDASICGLGQAAPNPLLCYLKYFEDDFQK
ncbi:MAG: NAD(P)H-dependent oxidoreductase subunit E [Alphaproteobacteria bacterium]|nr:NAD(P)H-dependent oxidoreductase subunit E [Alphaproteobacteria bacterium]